jgi:hypothetical protein
VRVDEAALVLTYRAVGSLDVRVFWHTTGFKVHTRIIASHGAA